MVATAAIGGALIAGGAFSTVGSGAVVVASMIGAYLVTDMGTAMVHVVIDTLDCERIPESLPWLRRLVEDFQNHHENPPTRRTRRSSRRPCSSAWRLPRSRGPTSHR